MTSESRDSDGNLVITIDEALSAYEVADLKDRMLAGFANHNGVVLEIGAVTTWDTLGIQLLYAADKTARMSSQHFRVTGQSETFRNAVEEMGMKPEDDLNSLGG